MTAFGACGFSVVSVGGSAAVQRWRFVGDEDAIKLKSEGVWVNLGVDSWVWPEDDDLWGVRLLGSLGVDSRFRLKDGFRVDFAAPG